MKKITIGMLKDESFYFETEGGKFVITPKISEDYPGVDVEFIPDNQDEKVVSNPRILFEKPQGGKLRALVWNHPYVEDYTTKLECWDNQ